MIRILVRTVGKIAFPMRPYLFNGIEFRRIAGEPVDVKSFGLFQEGFHICPPVDETFIPNQDNMPAQMAQQIPQERDDFPAGDIVSMKTDIQTQTAAARGYGDTPDGRNFITAVAVTQDWRTALGGPRFPDIWYEQETTFVQKDDMRVKLSGFFLYGAMSCASTVLWLFRLFARHVFPAFGSSIRNRGVTSSIRRHAYTEFHSRPESAVRYVSASIARWSTLRHRPLSIIFPLAAVSVVRSNGKAAPISLDCGFLSVLFSGKPDTNALPNSGKLSPFEKRHGTFCLNGACLWPADDVFPVLRDSHVVSYPVIYMMLANVSIIS